MTTPETERAELLALDPLEMLLDAARFAEGNGGTGVNLAWAKAARKAVAAARLSAPVEQAGEVVDPLWKELCELFGLDGWHDGVWQGHPTPRQIVTHIEYIANERARLLKESLTPQPVPGFAEGFEACREACKRVVAGELLQDCTGTPDDIAYNNAINCALAAIASLRYPAAPDGRKEVAVEELARAVNPYAGPTSGRPSGAAWREATLIASTLLSKFTITPKVQS